MHCKGCDKLMQGIDITINPQTEDYDDLCYTCRSAAYDSVNNEELKQYELPLWDTSHFKKIDE